MESIIDFLFTNEILIYLLLFTILLGFEVISKVPSILHTPLMSGANAISGIVILGAIILIRNTSPDNYIGIKFIYWFYCIYWKHVGICKT